MPDWSYRTLFRPLLFRLRADVARDLCLGFMGRLARIPLGPSLIDFLGHMRPSKALLQSVAGVEIDTPIGLGGELDPRLLAGEALARFGVGWIEIGPVTLLAREDWKTSRRDDELRGIVTADPPANLGAEATVRRLASWPPTSTRRSVRLGVAQHTQPQQATDECCRMAAALAGQVDWLSLDTLRRAMAQDWSDNAWREHVEAVAQTLNNGSTPRPLLIAVPCETSCHDIDRYVQPALLSGARGIMIAGDQPLSTECQVLSPKAQPHTLQLLQLLRERLSADLPIIACGGVRDPGDALDLLHNGADLVQIDAGLVYSGPGLPKRINDAVVDDPTCRRLASAPSVTMRAVEQDWFWALLLGLGMIFGGSLALFIAATRVVLPYDESFICMSVEQLDQVNSRMLAFLCHDRVTLAGAMLAIGVLYTGLAYYGMRRGMHWARVSVLTSGFCGFATFFLFLGFGYFDPFHAFVTVVLLQFQIMSLHSHSPAPKVTEPVMLYENAAWRHGQWGQLLLVTQGASLVVAGIVISGVGISSVFVAEDLAFMQTTIEVLRGANARLIPLVAHDRATLGGMLIACGLTVLMPALWGMQRRAPWLWWTWLVSGHIGYAAAIGVHIAVGYTDPLHLAPAFAGWAMLATGLALSRSMLCARSPSVKSRQAESRISPSPS